MPCRFGNNGFGGATVSGEASGMSSGGIKSQARGSDGNDNGAELGTSSMMGGPTPMAGWHGMMPTGVPLSTYVGTHLLCQQG